MQKKKVKRIDLVFENVEVVELDPTMFRGLWIHGITKSYAVNCAQYEAGEMWTDLVCSSFGITINTKGLEAETCLGTVLRKRLKHRDISHVHLIFVDGTKEYIGVPWGGDNQSTNEAQKHRCKWWKKGEESEINIEIRTPK